MYILWTSAVIMELRCRQVVELCSAKEKPGPLIQLKLDLAVLPKVLNYFALILPLFWTMDIGLMCVFWTNTEIIACGQLPLPLRKNCCTRATEIIELACCHWTEFFLKKGYALSRAFFYLYAPIKLHWDYRPGVWIRCSSVVIEPLCFKWTIYLIQPLFKHFLTCSRGAIMPDV